MTGAAHQPFNATLTVSANVVVLRPRSLERYREVLFSSPADAFRSASTTSKNDIDNHLRQTDTQSHGLMIGGGQIVIHDRSARLLRYFLGQLR
ncbi:hypothetical protein [Burkholderia metallica]|uniref:hypothetical protein n=1 Tax=Burkholderia metallica TaxID=488729 RepID=UPI0015751A69|nr:hypothetical protein [Burkholderia metallica]NTZ04292.1 hypothetical protein [Burkholderia metallica]